MKVHFPFRNLEPTFFAGLLDDPVLLLRTRSSGRHLMFDCGQVHHLAKRIFSRLDAIFISHAHMDHWMGIDSVVRQLIATARTVDIYGPRGLADRMENKLAGYDWNLVEDYWCSFRVHELAAQTISSTLFPGPQGFRRQPTEIRPRAEKPVYQTPQIEVLSEICEHRVDSLIFRVNERPSYLIDKSKLAEMGLVPGPWLRELKNYFLRPTEARTALTVPRRDEVEARVLAPEHIDDLLAELLMPQRANSIGYISDIGFNERNRGKIRSLLSGVDLLCCECTFLAAEKERARSSSHLCTLDVNQLLRDLRPAFFLPMHLSKTYSRRHGDLYRELDPPPGTTVLQLPLQVTPRPLLATEIAWRIFDR